MDIPSSKGVRITGPTIKFTGHSHTPQRRCSDSYWSFGPVMNNLLLAYKRNHPAMKQKHNSKEKLSGTYHNPMMYVAVT
jgi:hypothetical protein